MYFLTGSPIPIALVVIDCFLNIAGPSTDICGEDRYLQRAHYILSSVLVKSEAAAVKSTRPLVSSGCKVIGCEGAMDGIWTRKTGMRRKGRLTWVPHGCLVLRPVHEVFETPPFERWEGSP